MYGLRSPTAGHLTVDGCDPGDMRPDVLRARVALVRGTEMFHATIEENIHLHREDVSATDVRDVLRALGLSDAVLRLEDGWSTMLASGGAPLTENQCRLLGMARAIVGRPALLLVDGVLDGLSDEELEPVLEFLTKPEQPWTLVIATGREAIAERCATKIRLENHSSTVRS
jgi:ABC-type bacteriocin/lantibiotic exporter with double-glycine peptidase domain